MKKSFLMSGNYKINDHKKPYFVRITNVGWKRKTGTTCLPETVTKH
jgi:hypothetical protein